MTQIITYNHHGVKVHVREDLKGHHSAHSLCYKCARFIPDHPMNCRLAQAITSFCRLTHVVLPVWECAVFKPAERQ
jgi:hypothetical protein